MKIALAWAVAVALVIFLLASIGDAINNDEGPTYHNTYEYPSGFWANLLTGTLATLAVGGCFAVGAWAIVTVVGSLQ